MKYIVSFSGGKDSTAMLLRLVEEKKPIDDIVFCDTGKEFPDLIKQIDTVENYINMPITRISADKRFDEYFLYHNPPPLVLTSSPSENLFVTNIVIKISTSKIIAIAEPACQSNIVEN